MISLEVFLIQKLHCFFFSIAVHLKKTKQSNKMKLQFLHIYFYSSITGTSLSKYCNPAICSKTTQPELFLFH